MYCVLRDKLLSRGRIGAKTDQKIVAKKSAWSKVEKGRSRWCKFSAGVGRRLTHQVGSNHKDDDTVYAMADAVSL